MNALLAGGACMLVGALVACGRAPDADRHVVVSESSITLMDERGSASVAVADLERVEVRTNDRGPMEDDMFWVFITAARTLEVPSGIPGEKDLWPLFDRLPGFDYGKVIEASTSVENATHLCWVRAEQEPPPADRR